MSETSKTAARGNNGPRFLQLDGLRACAVIGVIVAHVLMVTEGSVAGAMPFGRQSVGLFFALSGFLITGILLRCRKPVGERLSDQTESLKNFYIRRFLRIFPLYYATLAIVAVSNFEGGRHAIFWHLTYTSNILIAVHSRWIGALSHFWTLSVEEQFYLVWPWLILFLPKRAILPTIVGAISVGPLFRLCGYFFGLSQVATEVLPLSWLDVLGMGALLAVCHFEPKKYDGLRRVLRGLGLWVGVPVVVAVGVIRLFAWKTFPDRVVFETAMALVSILLIDQATTGFKGVAGRFLSWGPMCYLGKISYGIYMFHNFVIPVLHYGFKRMHYQPGAPIRFVLVACISIGVASVSWHFFEKPLNDLKDRFSYGSGKRVARVPALPVPSLSPQAVLAGE